MNIALILAAGVGQRMRNEGLPKQFLKLMGKPIISYTIEKFQNCREIDRIFVACHNSWMDYMEDIVHQYQYDKVEKIFVGGNERQSSIRNGLELISLLHPESDNIILIHDGVRPLVSETTIRENIRVAKKYGNAMTVKAVKESVIVTKDESVGIDGFMNRNDTYSLTSPQSFQLEVLMKAYAKSSNMETKIPLIDSALVLAATGIKIHLVKEQDENLKVTTPEDFYYLRGILEMEEQKYIFGL